MPTAARWARYRRILGSSSRPRAPSISYTGSPFTWYDYFTSVNLAASNAGGPITSYAVQAGTLPTGVSLNTSTGAITGTPTALKTAANVTIRATGPGGTSDAILNIAVAWFPTSIAGLVAGYDTEAGFSSLKTASDGSGGEAADTDAVGYMADLSGNANHVIQATADNKPSVDADGLNSKRCLLFGGNDRLQKVTFAGGAETQPNTVLVVAQLAASTAGQALVDGGSGTTRHSISTFGGTPHWFTYAGVALDSGDNADTALHLHVGLFNGVGSFYFLDGTSIGSGDAGAQDLDGLTVGDDNGGAQPILSGGKGAVWAAWAGDIGSTARADLKTWAVAKWGTPA